MNASLPKHLSIRFDLATIITQGSMAFTKGRTMFRSPAACVVALCFVLPLAAQDAKLPLQLRDLNPDVFSAEAAREKHLADMVSREQRSRIHEAHDKQAQLFAALHTR